MPYFTEGGGAVGPQGIQGLQGVQGATGSQGVQGAKGDTGDAGAQGIQGVQGIPGEDGADGGSAALCVLTKSVNQNVGGANGTVVYWTWNGQDKVDTGFTHSTSTNPSRVQVDADGWYEIIFTGNAQQTGSSRITLEGVFRVNGGTIQLKGTRKNYSRGASYGNVSPGVHTVVQLSNGDYIEVGSRVEDADSTYTVNTTGGEIGNDEDLLIVKKVA